MEIQNTQVTEMTTIAGNDNTKIEQSAYQKSLTVTEIQAWLISYLSQLLEIEPDEVDVTIPFKRYGLDSSAAVIMTGSLEDWLGRELSPTLPYDYPTIQAIAGYLAEESKVKV